MDLSALLRFPSFRPGPGLLSLMPAAGLDDEVPPREFRDLLFINGRLGRPLGGLVCLKTHAVLAIMGVMG